MAALPAAAIAANDTQAARDVDLADDIACLRAILQWPELDYVDVSAQAELQQAIQRWPLLTELSIRPEPSDDALSTDAALPEAAD